MSAAAIAEDNAAKVAKLTPREREVLVLTAKGCGWKDCARRTGLTHGTVQSYRARIRRKLEVGSMCEASVIAAKVGLV